MRWDTYGSDDHWFQRLVGGNITYVRLDTNADGACALHGAFGECGSHELKCKNARRRAADGILRLHQTGGGAALNRSVYAAIWSELAGPAAEAKEDGTQGSNEAACLWNHLSESLHHRAITHVRERRALEATVDAGREQLRVLSRGAFNPNAAAFISEFFKRLKPLYSGICDFDVQGIDEYSTKRDACMDPSQRYDGL